MRHLALILLLATSPATASEIIEYTFDIILFENTAAKNEYLSDHAARAFIAAQYRQELEAMEDEVSDSEQEAGSEARVYDLEDSALNFRENEGGALDGALNRLERSDNYQVLARRSWTQSGFQDGDSVRIDFSSQSPSNGADALPLLTQAGQNTQDYLQGHVTFTFSRYIHLRTDLVLDHSYDEALSDAPLLVPGDTGASHVSLERKLRSNETHYVDHPLLGVLVNITREKITEPES